jgi:hypothetical protein
MLLAAQVIEKNRFQGIRNRATILRMSDAQRNRSQFLMLLMAAVLAAATLAPVTVLTG